ncbi:UNVERIFIED_CONTAM: hypothetical protein GTU68_045662 [Idotea baltica]|nr:hypothetical protein [Idotea baltica]
MSVVRQIREVENLNEKMNPVVDYKANQSIYIGARFLRECCIKLNAAIPTMCTAATYFHKFFNCVKFEDYDSYLIGCTCIYLASKVKNDDIKIRDIINIGYHTIRLNEAPLSLDPYFELRDSLVETELLLMRMLKFDLSVDLPQKHLLFYLNALEDWLGKKVFQDFPVVKTAWTLLLDIYHLPIVLNYTPPAIATSAIYLTFQIYGISVPGSKQMTDSPWFCHLHPDCKVATILKITTEIINGYSLEKELKFVTVS